MMQTNLIGRVAEYCTAGDATKEDWRRGEVFLVEARPNGVFVWMRDLESNRTVNRPVDGVRVQPPLLVGDVVSLKIDPQPPKVDPARLSIHANFTAKDGQLWLIEAEEMPAHPRRFTFYIITRSTLDVPNVVEGFKEVSGRPAGAFIKTLAITPVVKVAETFVPAYLNVADQRKR